MTRTPKISLDGKSLLDEDQFGISSGINRKNNYKNQKPILEKRRRDRINSSLDELKNLLLALKHRDPLRYARLEKADILEMVVKHLKDIKKRQQSLIVAIEPILYRNFKMGYMDCTKATIDFINDIESSDQTKKQQIIEHVTQKCMKTIENQIPPQSFNEHFQTSLGNMNSSVQPFSLPLSPFESELVWPEIVSIPDLKLNSLSFVNNFDSNFANSSSIAALASTSTQTSETLRESISIDVDSSDDDKDNKNLIIDDPNNNQTTWRPWL